MKHYKFGYARVSTEQQNLARQLDMLTQYGVDYIFNEKMTGTKRDRPELNKLLDRMMEGDTVVIESLSRLGRSTKDLIELVELFRERGVHLVSLKEQIDTSTPAGKLLFTLIKAAFGQRRKTLANALGGVLGASLGKAGIVQLITDCGFDARVRGEKLSLEDFAALTQLAEQRMQQA